MGLEMFKGLGACKSCGTCGYGRGPNNPWLEEPAPSHRCPELERYKFLSYSPRGMLYLARLMNSKQLSINADVAQIFYACTGCALCEELCFKPFMDIFQTVKEKIAKENPEILGDRKKATDCVRQFKNPFGEQSLKRDEWAKDLKLPKRGDTVFFVGCRISYKQAEEAKAVLTILKAANMEIAYLGEDEWCCGWGPQRDGFQEVSEAMAVHNVEVIKATGARRVIFACPHGYAAFKKQCSKIVGHLPFEILHLTELLAVLIKDGKIKFNSSVRRLTYHDPCILGRHSGIYEQPREILRSIPGVELVEMERNRKYSWCCGGTVDYAEWCSKERLMEAKRVADTLVTACPLCFENLSSAAKKEGIRLTVLSLPILLAKELAT
jgi:heterodisulfide reductase subunit D